MRKGERGNGKGERINRDEQYKEGKKANRGRMGLAG